MKQLLVHYTPSELDWSAEDLQLEEAPPSVRRVPDLVDEDNGPPTDRSLPRFELDDADDTGVLTPMQTAVVPEDAWPYDFPESSRGEGSYVATLPKRDEREAVVARHVDLARRSGIEDPVGRIDRSGLDRQHGGGSRPGAARAED